MKLRSMTCLYLVRDDKILLLYRVGSRVGPDSWRGIGGHFEAGEHDDPKACILRELREETGLMPWDITGLRLRYITVRQSGGEIRQNYYYFASPAPGVSIPETSPEGKLEFVEFRGLWRRFMPQSARAVIMHYLKKGRYDERIYCGAASFGGVKFEALDEIK